MINLVTGLITSMVITAGSASLIEPVMSGQAQQEKYVAGLLCETNARMYRLYISKTELSEVVDRCSKKAAQAIDERYGPVLSLLKPLA